MKTVWKFTVKSYAGLFIIRAPKSTSFLSVASQHGYISIWGEVENTQEEMEDRVIEVFETGEPIPENDDSFKSYYMYLGTARFQNDDYILHVYERVGD